MRKINIQIENKELTSLIERCEFELDAYFRVIRFMLADKSYENIMDIRAFKEYHDLYEQKTVEYNLLKKELENMMIPDSIKEHNYEWVFKDNVFSLIIKCDCFDKYSEKEMEDIMNGKEICGAISR